MSRRVTFCVLAATAALIASPASADRECFEQSCRMLNFVAPPASAIPAADVGVVLAQLAHQAPPPKFAGPPRPAHRAQSGAQAVRHGRGHRRARHDSGFFLGDYLLPGGYANFDLPVYPDAKVLPDDRNVPSDSSWRLCQITGDGVRYDPYDCEPYDYHPYGIYGHRPNGTYVEQRMAPKSYVVAPSAKVIRIDSKD
jgi:hypothetical protein